MAEVKELKIIKDLKVVNDPLWLYSLLKIYTNLDPLYNWKSLAIGAAGLSKAAAFAYGWDKYQDAVDKRELDKQLKIAGIIFNDRLRRLCERFGVPFEKPTRDLVKLATIAYVTGEGNPFVEGIKRSQGTFMGYHAQGINEWPGTTALKRPNISPTTGKGYEFANRVEDLYNKLNTTLEVKKSIPYKRELTKKKSKGVLWAVLAVIGIVGAGWVVYKGSDDV